LKNYLNKVKREKIEIDVLCVGGGIASLSTVLQLLNQIEKSGLFDSQNKKSPSIMILEKGREIGSHTLSGAVVDSESLSVLLENNPLAPPFLSRLFIGDIYYTKFLFGCQFFLLFLVLFHYLSTFYNFIKKTHIIPPKIVK